MFPLRDDIASERVPIVSYLLLIANVLVFALWKFAWPSLAKTMESRTEKIRSSLSEAEEDALGVRLDGLSRASQHDSLALPV